MIRYRFLLFSKRSLKTHEIKNYFKVGQEVLSNIALEVDLTGRIESPLQASNCFRTLARVVMNWGGGTGWKDYFDTLRDPIQGHALRKEIIEASHRKAMGDILQELIAVVRKGGYNGDTRKQTTRPMLEPDDGRMFFANDKPSGTRFMNLALFGVGDINPNCFGGFMNNSGAFSAAYRAAPAAGSGGGRKRRTLKNRRYKRRTRNKKRTFKKKPRARKNNKKRTKRNHI